MTLIDDCDKEQKVLEAKREKFRSEQLKLKKEREERKLLSSPSQADTNDKTTIGKNVWQEQKSASAKKKEAVEREGGRKKGKRSGD